ncbi:MAG TPA: beta-propeller fold lactonase family protein [Ktedonobacterales bacterium]|nr:beta-propeller fold lactonase family protein [Ktedonobacterales bacterium]
MELNGAPYLLGVVFLMMLVALAVWWGGAIPSAHADGGAPNLAYVVGGGKSGDQLVVLDIGQRSIAWSVALGSQPQAVVLSADGRFAYIPEAGANRVAMVDTSAHQVIGSMAVGSGPQAIATDPSGGLHWLFVANKTSNTLTVLDADTHRARATLAVGQGPVAVAVATSTSGIRTTGNTSALEVYVANRESRTLSVITTNDLHTVATIALPDSPCALTIPAAGGIAYVATCSGKVLAVGLASHQVLGVLLSDLGGDPGLMDYDAVTGQIYVPVPARDQVVLLRPVGVGADGGLVAPAEPLRTLPYSGAPSAVAITFDGALGFVTKRDSGRVEEIDVTTRQTLGTIAIGGAPNAVVTGPYPPALNRDASSTITAWVYGAFALAVVVLLAFMVRGYLRDSRRGARQDNAKLREEAD